MGITSKDFLFEFVERRRGFSGKARKGSPRVTLFSRIAHSPSNSIGCTDPCSMSMFENVFKEGVELVRGRGKAWSVSTRWHRHGSSRD
jgi:hypothetical protein